MDTITIPLQIDTISLDEIVFFDDKHNEEFSISENKAKNGFLLLRSVFTDRNYYVWDGEYQLYHSIEEVIETLRTRNWQIGRDRFKDDTL